MENKQLYTLVLSAVIFNKENKILLAKRSMDEDVLPGYWGIPGGKANKKDDTKDFLKVELKREILEEMGIKIKSIEFLESHLHGASGKVQISFTADIDSGKPKALEEVEQVEWFTLEEAKNMQLTPMTLERMKLACKKRKLI